MRTVPIAHLQHRLAAIWGVVFLVAFVLMLLMADRLQGASAEGWGWFTQSLVPMAGIVVAGLVRAQTRSDERTVTAFFAIFATIALAFYGTMVLLSLFLAAFKAPMLRALQLSSIPLGILQGLLAGILTFAFNREEQEPQRAKAT